MQYLWVQTTSRCSRMELSNSKARYLTCGPPADHCANTNPVRMAVQADVIDASTTIAVPKNVSIHNTWYKLTFRCYIPVSTCASYPRRRRSCAEARIYLPEQKQALKGQKKLDAMEQATANQRTENKGTPRDASMLYGRKTDSNTPVSMT